MIEFREIHEKHYAIFADDQHTGVYIAKCTDTVVLDPIGCAGAFDISELEAILTKMKELQGEKV